MTKRFLMAVCAATLMTAVSARAEAGQNAPPVVESTAVRPQAAAQTQPAVNVQLDIVITDTISGKPEAKTLTLVMRSGGTGSVRTSGSVPQANGSFPVTMAVDARVNVVQADLIDAFLTFEYQAASTASERTADANPAAVTERVQTYVRSGRRVLVSRSADPVTNRTVTVELTATVREP